MQTLKIVEYRGYNVYIRHLGQEIFEYLIPEKTQVFQQSFEFNRPKGKKRNRYSEEEYKNIANVLTEVALEFLDATLVKRSFKYKANKFIHTCQQKAEKLITRTPTEIKITT